MDVPHQFVPSLSFIKISSLLPGIWASCPSCLICWMPNVLSFNSHCMILFGSRGASFFGTTYVTPSWSFVPYTFSNTITPKGTLSSACLTISSHVISSSQSKSACSINCACFIDSSSPGIAGLTNHFARLIGSVVTSTAARTVPSLFLISSNIFIPCTPCRFGLYSSLKIPRIPLVPESPNSMRGNAFLSGSDSWVIIVSLGTTTVCADGNCGGVTTFFVFLFSMYIFY